MPGACSAWATSSRLVEEVQKGVDVAAAQKLADKVKSGDSFDLNDFLSQISQMKKMGGLSGLIDKLPTQMTGQAASSARPTWTAPSATCAAWKASSAR